MSTGQSPALASSTRTPWSSSTSPAAADERREQRCGFVAERLVAVEPAAQLPFLPASQGRDPPRVVRVALDERERLQHRIVNAGGDLGPLLGADPSRPLGIPLEREAPHPGPGDEEQRAGDGSRREQRGGRAFAREEHDGADGRKRHAPVGERCVRAEAAALAPREGEPAGDQRDPDHRLVGEAECSEERDAREEGEHRGDPDAIPLRRPGPESEVEEDPGPARQREKREDEADEGGVDPEGPRDARADPRDHSLVGAGGERPQHPGSSYGAVDHDLAGTDARIDDEHALAGLDQLALDVAPVAADPVRQLDLADLDRRVDPHGGVGGEVNVQVTDVDAHIDAGLTGGQLEAAQIEVERADPELVVVLQLLRRSRRCTSARRCRSRGRRRRRP